MKNIMTLIFTCLMMLSLTVNASATGINSLTTTTENEEALLESEAQEILENKDDVSDAIQGTLKDNGIVIAGSLVLLMVLVVFIIRSSKKKDKIGELKSEINGYMKLSSPYEYSGIISFNSGKIYYSRGNKSIMFDVPVDKETYLAPFMVDEWFEGRNYSLREANIILSDIAHYLKEMKYSSTVILLSDEEYENALEEKESEK